MKTFSIPTIATVSKANQIIFEKLQSDLGKVPNLYAMMAHSEDALGTYLTLQHGRQSLNAKEREVIHLVVSQVNECEYCLAAHTLIGGMAGFTPAQLIAIRKGSAAFDPKLDALARMTKNITEKRGRADARLVDAFFAAGYTDGHLVDTLMLIGERTITNFLDALTDVPIDFPTAPTI